MILSRRNRLIITSIVVLGAIVLAFIIYDINESEDDLLFTMREESRTLIESLTQSIENSVVTNREIERLQIERLNAVASLAGHISSERQMNSDYLRQLCGENDISHISIFDSRGRLDASSSEQSHLSGPVSTAFLNDVQPVISGDEQWIDLGLMSNPVTWQEMYLIAAGREERDGFVLAGILSDTLLEFRRRIGIGKKIQDIGDNPNIVYTAMQDEQGIISASENISELESIPYDKFLAEAWQNEEISTRTIKYQGDEIFEAVKAATLDNNTKFMLRLGLSLDSVEAVLGRSVRRAWLVGIGIFITGGFLIAFVFTREKFLHLQEEQKKVQTYTSLILNSITDAVIAVDRGGKITVFNKAAENIFDIAQDESIDRKYRDYFPSDSLKIIEAMESGKSPEYWEIGFRTEKGGRKIIGVSISFIKTGDKGEREIDTCIAIVRDLTEQKQMSERLNRQERLSAMGELAGGVAHEIRNPLNAINIITQRFEYEFEPEDDKDEYLKLVKTVRSEVERVNSIITQFLEFARPGRVEKKEISAPQVIKESAHVVESQAKKENITMEADLAEDFTVLADKQKLKQAFLNMMQNSIEAMPDGGKITYSARKDKNNVIFVISDTGGGIPEEKIPKIFNLYYTSKSDGTGLGLSIVHQIISEHGGEIRVDSTVGEGTTMKIILPAD